MTCGVRDVIDFLDAAPKAALVEVTKACGSTPRDAGTWMLVSQNRTFGTIGGGQLEYMAIDEARRLLDGKLGVALATRQLSIPLGPEIGQCCGGRVAVSIVLVGDTLRTELIAQAEAENAARPYVYVFGGGHVGHALASSFALLPVQTTVVETRAGALDGIPDTVETLLTAVPESAVRDAPAGSVFAILTHDHSLDFVIVAEALKRTDAAYVGMIGSRTKKATFRSWFLKAGGSEIAFARLVSPIGGSIVDDKRPPVIAALAAAEIMTALARFAPTKAVPQRDVGRTF